MQNPEDREARWNERDPSPRGRGGAGPGESWGWHRATGFSITGCSGAAPAPGARTRGGHRSLIEKAEVLVLALGPESDEGRKSGGLEIVSHCQFEQIPVMAVRHSSTPIHALSEERKIVFAGKAR